MRVIKIHNVDSPLAQARSYMRVEEVGERLEIRVLIPRDFRLLLILLSRQNHQKILSRNGRKRWRLLSRSERRL